MEFVSLNTFHDTLFPPSTDTDTNCMTLRIRFAIVSLSVQTLTFSARDASVTL